jgi:hypothetical protein
MPGRKVWQGLYVPIPMELSTYSVKLTMAKEDSYGEYFPGRVFYQLQKLDLEAMGMQVMREYVRLARHNFPGT